MRIYKVARGNIVCPKELRIVEISKEDVISEIEKSVAYENMLETIDLSKAASVLEEEEYFYYLKESWIDSAYDDLMKNGVFDLGDYLLVVEVE